MFKLRLPLTLFLLTFGTIVSLLHGYEKTTGFKLRIRNVKQALLLPSAALNPQTSNVPGFQDAPSSCSITDLVNDPLVKEYGQNNIRLSRTYEGSGTRVRKVLEKAQRGEHIKIAAVGGSVSAVSSIQL